MTLTHLANTVGPVYLYLAVLGTTYAACWIAIYAKRRVRVREAARRWESIKCQWAKQNAAVRGRMVW